MAARKHTGRLVLNSFCLLLSGLALGWMVGLAVSPVIQTILTSLIAVVVSLSTALAGLRLSDSAEAQDKPPEPAAGATEPGKSRKFLPAMLDPLPVASMVIGLAIGASVGLYARTNDWLGARTNNLVAEWKATGLSDQDITRRVFDSLYPPPGPQDGARSDSSASAHERGSAVKTETVASAATPPGDNTAPKPKPQESGERKAVAPKPAAVPRASVAEQSQNQYRHGVLFNVSLDECARLRNAEGDDLRREMASSSSDGLVSLAKTCKNDECLRAGVNKACAKYK